MPSNEGNEGNEGNTGSAGASGNATSVSGGWFFANRIDLPFSMDHPAGQPDATLGWLPPLPMAMFPDRNWAAQWRAWLAVIEFSVFPWQAQLVPAAPQGWPGWVPVIGSPAFMAWIAEAGRPDWQILAPPPPPIPSEINQLVTAAANERADALGEILSQSDEFISYFLNLVTARPGSHPATTAVLTMASLIGTFTSMYFKQQYQRPRPSQLCPALLPPIEVPGHASFPSGHSTQGHLMALCLADVLQLGFDPLPPPPAPATGTMATTIWALAERIARNREIAGLHYPSDSAAGVAVALSTFAVLKTAGAVPTYEAMLVKAQAEWS